jgi:hypothetical protein
MRGAISQNVGAQSQDRFAKSTVLAVWLRKSSRVFGRLARVPQGPSGFFGFCSAEAGGNERLQLRVSVPLALSREAMAGLSARAAAKGCSEARLACDLLEMIERDDLYDAVLDLAPLQPSD